MATISQIFASDASRLEGQVYQKMRETGRVSMLMEKQNFPDGIGYNPSTVSTLRSGIAGGSGWTRVQSPDTPVNNCQLTPGVVTPARLIQNYYVEQNQVMSSDICLTDGRFSYEWEEQVTQTKQNFVGNITDLWEDRSKYWFQYWANKVVFNSSSTITTGTAFTNTPATYIASQSLLYRLYNRIMQDGGGVKPYAFSNGAAQLTLVCSAEASQNIIQNDANIRQDIRFAQMGKDSGAMLLQSWGIDRAYGGFMHCIDYRMPRYNFVGGEYVQVPYYIDGPSSIGGPSQIVNPDYDSALYEVMYIWNPKAVIRQTPKPKSSLGAGTSFKAVNYNGDVIWANIPNKETNLFQSIGVYAADLMAAFKPTVNTQYAFAIMVLRCPATVGNTCPSY